MKALLIYSSTDGQTKAITHCIAAEISQKISCDIREISALSEIQLSDYQLVMIGASIRYGRFSQELYRFTTTHQQELNQIPSAFFSVNLTARKAGKNSPETNTYTRKFLQKTPWHPTLAAVFAGALYYPRYHWFDRMMIQFIMKLTGGETDSSKEVEYTDWEQVKQFAQQFAQLV